MRKDRVSLLEDKWQHAISSLSHKSSLDLFICVSAYLREGVSSCDRLARKPIFLWKMRTSHVIPYNFPKMIKSSSLAIYFPCIHLYSLQIFESHDGAAVALRHHKAVLLISETVFNHSPLLQPLRLAWMYMNHISSKHLKLSGINQRIIKLINSSPLPKSLWPTVYLYSHLPKRFPLVHLSPLSVHQSHEEISAGVREPPVTAVTRENF